MWQQITKGRNDQEGEESSVEKTRKTVPSREERSERRGGFLIKKKGETMVSHGGQEVTNEGFKH